MTSFGYNVLGFGGFPDRFNPVTSTMAYIIGRADYYEDVNAYNITTTGNAISFGDLQQTERSLGVSSNTTQALITGFNYSNNANIDKLNLTSLGNSTSFGNLTQNSQQGNGLSNSTRAVHSIGYTANLVKTNSIEYMTFGSSGNGTDFGDLTATMNLGCSSANSSRGLFGCVAFNVKSNVINYITIASTGNATDFGDLFAGRNGLASCASTTRSIQCGGDAVQHLNAINQTVAANSYSDIIDYVTIASAGNATDFGDLDVGSRYVSAAGSTTRGTITGGQTSGGDTDRIEYVTIASTGNGTDFGNLIEARIQDGGCSNCHGGL